MPDGYGCCLARSAMKQRHKLSMLIALLSGCGAEPSDPVGPEGREGPGGSEAPGSSEGSEAPGDSEGSEALASQLVAASVTIENAGSVRGRVTSEPGGLDCSDGCTAKFASGTELTLRFHGEGAGQVAQFYVTPAGGESSNCAGHAAATALTCVYRIEVDTAFRVFPVSVPPQP
jgi:hypothetical protein